MYYHIQFIKLVYDVFKIDKIDKYYIVISVMAIL